MKIDGRTSVIINNESFELTVYFEISTVDGAEDIVQEEYELGWQSHSLDSLHYLLGVQDASEAIERAIDNGLRRKGKDGIFGTAH